MKIYYHNDLDGHCSGAIAFKWARHDQYKTDLLEVDYKDDLHIEDILLNETVLIVDFSFSVEAMEEVLKKTNNIIWIDHHKTAVNRKYSQELAGLRRDGTAACKLTWEFFCTAKMPRGVELIGDMDIWKWEFGGETERFVEALRLYPNQPGASIWHSIFSDDYGLLRQLQMEGETAIRYRESLCENYRDYYGFETEFEGYKTYVVGLMSFGSKTFGLNIKKYPLCVCYAYDGKTWKIRLYSETLDVSEIAEKHGGGGHRGAGGWEQKEIPEFLAYRPIKFGGI